MSETVFARLCDITDDLQRLMLDLEHSPQKLALEVIVNRLDAVIDATVGLEGPALKEDLCT